jgi:hypothetical protein
MLGHLSGGARLDRFVFILKLPGRNAEPNLVGWDFLIRSDQGHGPNRRPFSDFCAGEHQTSGANRGIFADNNPANPTSSSSHPVAQHHGIVPNL